MIDEDASAELMRAYEEMSGLADWQNARDVFNNVLPAIEKRRSTRIMAAERSPMSGLDSSLAYTRGDVRSAVELMLQVRRTVTATRATQSKASALSSLGFGGGARAASGGGFAMEEQAEAVHKVRTEFNFNVRPPPEQPGTVLASEEDGQFDPELWEALEEACAAMKYDVNMLHHMLSADPIVFPPELLTFLMDKFNAIKVRNKKSGQQVSVSDLEKMLKPQCPKLLIKVRTIVEAQQRRALEVETETQMKLRRLGRCPMNFAWRKEAGGYRCEGGSHFCTDKEITQFCHDIAK